MKLSAYSAATVSLISSLALSGCLLKDMKEMHDATMSVGPRMDKTNEGVQHAGKTGDLTYTSLQKSTAKEIRESAFKELQELEELGAKYSSATAYVYAFQFQEWNPEYQTQAEREDMYYQAVAEYMKVVKEFMHDRDEVSPTSNKDRMKNLYAITAVLHRISPRQEALSAKFGFAQVSLYDLLSEAIIYNPNAEGAKAESDLPRYVVEARREMPDVIYSMRVRQNFLMALGYAKLAGPTNGDEFKFMEKAVMKLKYDLLDGSPKWVQSIFGNNTWSPEYNELNFSQIDYAAQIIERSLQTRELLIQASIDPMLDDTIVKFFEHADMNKSSVKDVSKRAAILRVESGMEKLIAPDERIEKIKAGN